MLLFSVMFSRPQKKTLKMHSNKTSEQSWTYMPTRSLGSASFHHQTINKLFSVATEVPASKYGSNFTVLSGCHGNRESASLTNRWPLCGLGLGGLAVSMLLCNYTFCYCRQGPTCTACKRKFKEKFSSILSDHLFSIPACLENQDYMLTSTYSSKVTSKRGSTSVLGDKKKNMQMRKLFELIRRRWS